MMEPTEAVHVTPELEPSFDTVAEKVCVACATIATGTVGIVTEMGFSVIVAVFVLVPSLMLVAVSVTVVTELITVVGALYVTPVVEEAVSVPTPEPMLQLTPELEESLLTESVNACELLVPMLAVAGLMAARLMGVSGMVMVVVLLVSVLLVAVITAVAVVTGSGAL